MLHNTAAQMSGSHDLTIDDHRTAQVGIQGKVDSIHIRSTVPALSDPSCFCIMDQRHRILKVLCKISPYKSTARQQGAERNMFLICINHTLNGNCNAQDLFRPAA